jgi:hypothetical protein
MSDLKFFGWFRQLSLRQQRQAFTANQGGVSWLKDLLVPCTEAK